MSLIKGRQFFVTEALRPGHSFTLPKALQHRLQKVLRLQAGEGVYLCDGLTGRYRATLEAGLKTAFVEELHTPLSATAYQTILWLGLPKRDAWESALRQATELGITAIQPILTRYSVPTKLNEERATTLLTEAAEQCERLTLPTLHPHAKLDKLVASFVGDIYWADETLADQKPAALTVSPTRPRAILVGPEGGFSPEEQTLLRAAPNLILLNLGPTILRTDTAVVAAIAKVLLP